MSRRRLQPLEVPLAGTRVVEASAGTGKTHAITTLVLRLLLEGRLPVGGILVVTYTKAATAELRDRIRHRIATALAACGTPEILPDSEAALRELLERRRPSAALDRTALEVALGSFDETGISTIHAFCQRVLRENAFECGASFDAELLADESRLRDEILRDFWVNELSRASRAVVMAALRDERLALRRLAGLVRKALADPGLQVLPETAPTPGAEALAAWRETRMALLDLWRRHRTEIERLLKHHPALSRAAKNYAPGHVDELLAGLEQALGFEEPAVSLRFPGLEELTPAALADRTVYGRSAPEHELFHACAQLHEAEAPWRAELVNVQRRLVERAREEATRRKTRLDRLSFDDLLLRVREALAGSGGAVLARAIVERYPAALIDEFQDTDPVQWEIFERVWHRAGAPLFLIGDPKQAIYGFRGADVFAYLRARRAAPDPPLDLDVNRRSDPGLLRALNAFFGVAARPFELEDIGYTDVEPASGRSDVLREAGHHAGVAAELTAPLRILLVPDENRGARGEVTVDTANRLIPPAVAGEIVRLLDARLEVPSADGGRPRRLGPGDIAVLCRTNAQAASVQDALRARGVPAVLQGDRSVFEGPEAGEIATILEAIAEPTDPRLLRAAMATSLYGFTAADIAAFDHDDAAFDDATARFFDWHEQWTHHGFLRAFRALLEGRDIPTRLLGSASGERRLTNVLHVAELLHRAAVVGHRGPHELIDWLRRSIEGVGDGDLAPEEVQIRLESDSDAVTLTTIHKAKGLEWPVVYCPYLWERSRLRFDDQHHLRFHDDDGRRCLDIGSADFDVNRDRAERENLAEGLRLLYVALTRARHQCSIVWGGLSGAGASPLARFLSPGSTALGSQAAIRDALRPLVSRAGEDVEIRGLGPPETSFWTAEGTRPDRLVRRTFGRGRLDDHWRTSSFTALAASPGTGVSREAREGVDRDEVAPEAPPVESAGDDDSPLADFPAGARAGILVHAILERVEFDRSNPELFRRTIESRLRASGFDPRWREPLERAITALLDTPIETPLGRIRLADVRPEKRLAEMAFTLPLVPESGPARVTPGALASVFARHAAPPVPADYASRLASLGFAALAGHLRGSIDLVFEHEGRFWLVDWKSNHLGGRTAAYRPERLVAEMAAHHYFLQSRLYAATLDRYLRRRLAGYEHERHFGGVLYLFVRGFRPGGDGRSGVCFDRPSEAFLVDLQTLFEKGELP